ncbi:MAG: hypothetical protein LAN37_04165 [Acidobacteriia bacterium]|nr:hypothetical protein [Terriglobia bacterium]
MLELLRTRVPMSAVGARLVTALHEAVYLGSTYSCLSLLAACVASLLELNGTTRLGR